MFERSRARTEIQEIVVTEVTGAGDRLIVGQSRLACPSLSAVEGAVLRREALPLHRSRPECHLEESISSFAIERR